MERQFLQFMHLITDVTEQRRDRNDLSCALCRSNDSRHIHPTLSGA